MSILRVALRLIVGVNICLHHTSRWTRMIWSGLPGTVQQFHAAQFLETTQRQFSGDPIGPNPLSLSPPY
jgi:hypothetical protein